MSPTPKAPTLEQWQTLYDDQAALLKDPEGHQFALIQLAEALHARGLLDDSELSDRLEQADAAYAWGVEEQLNQDLSGPAGA